MKIIFLIIFTICAVGVVGISNSYAFNVGGMVIEVPGQTMDISQNIIAPGEIMFVTVSFKQNAGDFTANIFKKYEDSRKLVLTLNPTTNEFGDFNFSFTIAEDWELGNYFMVLENGSQFMDWDFAVRKNYVNKSIDPVVYPDQQNLSPLKQFKSGITIENIKCKENLQLILKNNGSPACVKQESFSKLLERGWVVNYLFENEYDNTQDKFTFMEPNSMELFYYPEKPDTEKPDTYKLFMLIRLPEWMGGGANDASAYRAYSAKSLDDACIVKYWPDDGRQRIENPCQGAMYRVVDGAITTGLIHTSTPMTALPYLDLSIDENGSLYVEPPTMTITENGVIGHGRQISFDDFYNGSKFLAESFAEKYPEFPPIPLEFAGYDLSEIAPEQYRTTISYLDFPDNSGRISMMIGKQSVGPSYTYWTNSYSELFQLGDTAITVNKHVIEREDEEILRTYEIKFKDDGFYYSITGKNLEFIKKEIVRNFFSEHKYEDIISVSKNID